MKRTVRRVCVALAVAMASLSAEADCQLKKYELPVRLVGGLPVTPLTLNGREISMLVDSGAFFSMLPASTAQQLELPIRPLRRHISGYTGPIDDLSLVSVKQAQFGGRSWSDVEFIVGNNEMYGNQGVLGRSTLAMGDAEYDLANGVVRLVFPQGDCAKANLADWAGESQVFTTPLVGDDPRAPYVEVRINGTSMLALMDTGASRTALPLGAARRVGVKQDDLVQAGRVSGAGAGRAQSWMATFASFELGGEKIANFRMSVDDVDAGRNEMLLGLDYFLSHRVYVSRLQRKVYVTYNGGPVFSKDWDEAAQAGRRPVAALDDADALVRRASASAARGDLKGALADLERACALAPQEAACRLERARAYRELKRWDEALADFGEALKLAPALHAARLERAWLNATRYTDTTQVLADMQVLDAALPRSDHMRQFMAQIYSFLDAAVPEALRQWQLWLDTHPNDAHADRVLNSRCWLRTTRNIELPLALQDCSRAVAMDGKNADFLGGLGWTHLRLDNAPKALKAFDGALALKADGAWALYGRALAGKRLGDAEAMERDLAQARRIRPDIDGEVRKVGLPTAEPAATAASAVAVAGDAAR